jgi:hypothetical protein
MHDRTTTHEEPFMNNLPFTLNRLPGTDADQTRRAFLTERQKAHEHLAASTKTQVDRARELGMAKGIAEALQILATDVLD